MSCAAPALTPPHVRATHSAEAHLHKKHSQGVWNRESQSANQRCICGSAPCNPGRRFAVRFCISGGHCKYANTEGFSGLMSLLPRLCPLSVLGAGVSTSNRGGGG